MSTSIWLRQVRRRLFGRPSGLERRARKAPPAARAARPRLEVLEDRITPTTFTPTTFSDGLEGTLRAAIISANNDNGTTPDTIQLSAGTYQLTIPNTNGDHDISSTQGDLNITNPGHTLIIQGTTDANGNPTTVIQQTVIDRVFQIVNPATTVVFKDLVIEGGNAQDDGSPGVAAETTDAQGGGILDDGSNVSLSNVVVRSNQAAAGPTFFAQGGGVYMQDGVLTIDHSVIQNNTATGGATSIDSNGGDADGGGVAVVATGDANTPLQLTITNSTVADNTARGGIGGGGIIAVGGDGGDAHGGGVFSQADTNTITGSTLAHNTAAGGTASQGNVDGFGSGGGAELRGSNAIINSTIANNTVTGIGTAGGGVFFGAAASGQLTNVTVAGNQANEGGGLDNNNGDVKDVNLLNTLVALNTASSPNNGPDVRGEFISLGHNLIGIADGVNDPGFHAPGDLAGSAASPLIAGLESLANNGGPTQTIALLGSSPAINAGDNGAQGLTGTSDQRGPGFARVSGGTIDIGSYEVQASVSPPPPPSPPPSPPPGSPPPPPASPPSPPAPSLIQAIINVYIAEVEKDIGFGDPKALQQTIDFNSQFTIFAGINLAPFIEQIADANVAAARSGSA